MFGSDSDTSEIHSYGVSLELYDHFM